VSLDLALNIASGGLSNVAYGLSVVSQNVANASTPDFALETATQTSLSAGGQGFGVLSGVTVRASDPSLQAEVGAQAAESAAAATASGALSTLQPVLGTVGGGTDLGSRLTAVQSAFSTLEVDPGNATAQGSVVGAATALATGINTLSAAYGTARQAAQDGVTSGWRS
jgi:flagellar hook-associated protein 1 FlgK